jgi:hypothetical protein
VPPWEVIGEGTPSRLLWYLRWTAYESEKSAAMRDKQTHNG